MRNLMVLLFLLSFGTSAHAETLAERIEKIPGGTIDLCRGLAFTLFSQAAAGAPLEVLQGEAGRSTIRSGALCACDQRAL